jgi:asparagine synthase (glutamine-hydrolysing)
MLSLIENQQFIELIRFIRGWSAWPGRKLVQAMTQLVSLATPDCLRALALQWNHQDPYPRWLSRKALLDRGLDIDVPLSSERREGYRRRLMEKLRSSLVGRRLGALLRHGDRNSMRWSIESRVPFLTTTMAEYVLGLPECHLVSQSGQTKCVFRAAMRGIVPDVVLNRRDKIGFQTPERDWLAGQYHRIRDWMSYADQLEGLDPAACRKTVEEMLDGTKPYRPLAWRLINFCRWAQLIGIRD